MGHRGGAREAASPRHGTGAAERRLALLRRRHRGLRRRLRGPPPRLRDAAPGGSAAAPLAAGARQAGRVQAGALRPVRRHRHQEVLRVQAHAILMYYVNQDLTVEDFLYDDDYKISLPGSNPEILNNLEGAAHQEYP